MLLLTSQLQQPPRQQPEKENDREKMERGAVNAWGGPMPLLPHNLQPVWIPESAMNNNNQDVEDVRFPATTCMHKAMGYRQALVDAVIKVNYWRCLMILWQLERAQNPAMGSAVASL